MSRRPRLRSLRFEYLEGRRVLSALSVLPPIDPIDPNSGEATLLNVAQKHNRSGNVNALDDLAVPFVVASNIEGGDIALTNWITGAPLRLDVDNDLATGGDGYDVQIEVNTERPGVSPDWHLRLTVERLGSDTFLPGIGLAIAFPFDAFNDEALPGDPNILMGFEVLDGGTVPESIDMRLYPHQLDGSVHDVEWNIQTVGAASPIRFLSGHFDGNIDTGIQNAAVTSATIQNVPDVIRVDMSVAESALGAGATNSLFDLEWSASSTTPVAFNYLEAETADAASSPATADFVTEWTVDSMPTSEHLVVHLDETAGHLSVESVSNSSLGDMTFRKTRSDGLIVTADASNVPADMGLDLDLAGGLELDVDANTLDMHLQASQSGGFANTAAFFGYDLGYLSVKLEDAPDLAGEFNGLDKSFLVQASNAGEHLPMLEMIVDDDGQIDAGNAASGLELPPSYVSSDDVPPDARLHHLFSLIDNGIHGTAVARVVGAEMSRFEHDVTPTRETLNLTTLEAAPLQFYLRTGINSSIVVAPPSATGPDPYAEMTCNIDDVPAGHSTMELNLPLGFSFDTEQPVDAVSCFGHIGSLHSGLSLEDVPAVAGFDFRPEGSVDVVAEDVAGNPDAFGVIVAQLIDENGMDPNVIPLPVAGKTFFPADTRLKEASVRLDHVPSFSGLWDDQTSNTTVKIDTSIDVSIDPTNPLAYLDGFQLSVATTLPDDPQLDLTLLPPASDSSTHYARMVDRPGEQRFAGGLFGVDRFTFNSDDVGPKPSRFQLDWNLDPHREFTPFVLDVDAQSDAAGALGTFFGNDDVLGSLDLGYLPSHLELDADLDPQICTNGFFGIPLPIPSTLDMNFSVQGNLIRVHAEDLPPVFCVNWDTSMPTSFVQVLAQETNGDPAQAGLVEVLNQIGNTELRIRADEVPSLGASWKQTTDNPNFVLSTVAAPGEPFSILGGLRLKSSTTIGPPDLPVFPELTGSETHFVEFKDQGADKNLEVGIFGVDEVGVLVNSDLATVDFDYRGDAARELTLHVAANGGIFFPGQMVDFVVLAQDIPRVIDMVLSVAGDAMFMQASHGMDLIRIGGPDLLLPADEMPIPGEEGLPGRLDTKLVNLEISSLPDQVAYTFDQEGSLSILPETCPGFPNFCLSRGAPIQRVTAFIRDDDPNGPGLDGEQPMFSDPLRAVRLRLDEIPFLEGNWGAIASIPLREATETESPPAAGDVVIGRFVDEGANVFYSTAVLAEDGTHRQLSLAAIRGVGFSKGTTVTVADRLDYDAQEEPFAVGDLVRGFTSGATGVVRRVERTADRGAIYLDMVNGSFLSGESLIGLASVRDGGIDVNRDGVITPEDDGLFTGITVVDGRVDINRDAVINGADDGVLLGYDVFDGLIDVNGDNAISGADDSTIGAIYATTQGTLHEGGVWTATVDDADVESGFDFDFGSVAEDEFLAGMQLAVSSVLDLDTPLSAPTVDSAHHVRITDLRSALSDLPPAKRLELGVFGIDDVHVSMGSELTASYATDVSRPLEIAINRDFKGAFFEAENDRAMRLDVLVDEVPQAFELQSDLATSFEYQASSSIDLISIDGFFDEIDDGGLLNFNIIKARIDLDHDGDIDEDDTGIYDGVPIIAGHFDIDGSESIGPEDTGEVGGVNVIGGLVDVGGDGTLGPGDQKRRNGTIVDVGLVGLPASMRFGLSPASFEIVNGRLNVNIQKVGISKGRVDINRDGEINQDDDGRIGAVDVIDGYLDIDDDGDIDSSDDGEVLGFSVIDGRIDRDDSGDITEEDEGTLLDEEINEDDDGRFAGVDFIDGKLDLNNDGQADDDDDGFLLDVAVIDGKFDLNDDGVVNIHDDGQLSGAEVLMSDSIDLFSLHAHVLDDNFGMFDSPYRLIDLTAIDVPARWLIVWTGQRFVFETLDAAGEPMPIGAMEALISTSLDAEQIDQRVGAFQSTVPGIEGDVLDGTTPMRIHYSEYLQEIDSRYYGAGDGSEGVLERLRQLYANGSLLDTSEDHVAARMFGGSADFLSAKLSGFQKAAVDWTFDVFDIPFNDVPMDPPEGEDEPLIPADPTIPFEANFVLRAPSEGVHPLFVGIGNSTGTIDDEDDGVFLGLQVRNGYVDVNNDDDIDIEDTTSVAGYNIVNGKFDVNHDGSVDEDDDKFVRGVRIVDGRVDVSEQTTIAKIENVPDKIDFHYDFEAGTLSLDISDDVEPSAGTIDFYQGPVPFADDNDVAMRLVINDSPESLDAEWGNNLLEGGIKFDASNPFEILGIIQMSQQNGVPNRIVFGLEMEDLQVGYNVDLFSFEEVDSITFSLGSDIIDGRFDLNSDGSIGDDDDGTVGGLLGIGEVDVINGEVDINGDGSIGDADDGLVGTFVVIDGRIDVDLDGNVDAADDFTSTIVEIPSAWELFSAEIGIDNDADDSNIAANFDKPGVNGFLAYYEYTQDPGSLDPDGPDPSTFELLPVISFVLNDFREMSLETYLWLDPISPNIILLYPALGPLPFEFQLVNSVFVGDIIFDYWLLYDFEASFDVDYPDWVPLEDFTIGIANYADYTDNTPLHLLPIRGFFVTTEVDLVFTWLGLHEFDDHEDPFS